ncbi:MAG: O-antigen ligase family protein [Gammaproteobacteria bacterium]|nr:O-antigen ligase family protein [Gammaproteobacteria bacterium]
MRFALSLIVVLLVGKDTFQLGDPYVMRGFAQFLGLLIGIVGILTDVPRNFIAKYWPAIGYLISLIATSIDSSDQSFVLLQIGSLLAIVFFGIAYFNLPPARRVDAHQWLTISIIAVYMGVMIGSLVAAKLAPGLAYEQLFSGDAYGSELRFRGLFSKSGMMGAASGLTLGLAFFGIKSRILKILISVPTLICMFLTLSRTFWVASFVSGVITSWHYYPKKGYIVSAALIAALVVGLGAAAFNYSVDKEAASKIFRLNTLSTLSGRVDLWARGLKALEYRPWLGYGFTVGSEGLQNIKPGLGLSSARDARLVARTSLHSGYMQSILDSGIIGTLFYLNVIGISLWRFWRNDSKREFPAAFYGVLFFSIANFGENIIYSASVFHSVAFWILATLGLSLTSREAPVRPRYRNIGSSRNRMGRF